MPRTVILICIRLDFIDLTCGILSCTFRATKFQKFLYVRKNGILDILRKAFAGSELQRACRYGFGVFGSKDVESQQGRYYPAFRKVKRKVLCLLLESKKTFQLSTT
jgi:hypothetical protein